jgi:hypothetical protein
MNAAQVVQVFKCLLEAPHSRIGLAEKTGATPKLVGRLLTEMKKQKMIFVISYSNATDGRNRVKIYALGQGEDAQPRSSQPQAVRSRKSYVKKVQARKIANIKTTFVKGVPLWQ